MTTPKTRVTRNDLEVKYVMAQDTLQRIKELVTVRDSMELPSWTLAKIKQMLDEEKEAE